ncbi:MAG: cysteine methyltransferase [Desulfobacteraceae bacterium 4572_88]|nr:MAG: cysteine methyltransferase [Desulfobacteraceae bacterium 4572_88]
MNMLEIKQMNTVERLQIMEALWDSLLYDEIEIESPEWHRNILADRKRKIEEGKAEFVSIKELKANSRS